MKINDQSLCTVVNGKYYRDYQMEFLDSAIKNNAEDELSSLSLKAYKDKKRFWSETEFRTLVFTKKAKDLLGYYKVPTDIRVDVLKTLPNRKDIILVDEETCIKYVKNDDKLVFSVHNSEFNKVTDSYIIYNFYFSVDLVTGEVITDDYDYTTKKVIDRKEVMEKYYSLFMVVVTFLELTDVTLKVVEGKSKIGDIFKDTLLKNETRNKVIQVHSNWNIITVRVDDIQVRGHWRLQPFGSGRTQYKYIWIDPYTKGMTVRTAQKEFH
jgi:hypothetical protein